ncbi:MAG: GDSL family lipase [Clostridia bacterium]|nr:GDSL family lipase [Clostridia bacterium]
MKILFIGDSITDTGRDYSDYHDLGKGYPKYAAEIMREEYPDIDFEFINRGINAEQTKDVLKRVDSDIIDVNPDIVSILLGVNDTWHHVNDKNWIPAEIYESNYRGILEAIKSTGAKLVMLEQYVLPAPGMDNFHPDIDEKIQITRKLAREYADVYIPLDGLFASACVDEDPLYWTAEGVHPTEEGHIMIADYLTDAFASIIDNE